MAPISSPEPDTISTLTPEQRAQLLGIAELSIRHGLEQGAPLRPDLSSLPEVLRERRACFVTLLRGGNLRGCIGHLEAILPLAEDVAESAYSAAFQDPRFPRLSTAELADLEIHISVLSPPSPMNFTSEEDLLGQIQPGIDGLILQEGHHRGTFLPSVWEQLPEAKSFLQHLKQKAGLPINHWSDEIQVSRYRTESFP